MAEITDRVAEPATIPDVHAGTGRAEERDAVEFVHRRWRADAGELGAIRRELGRWIAPLGLADEEVADVVLAVDEATANVVQHAYPAGDTGDVELTLWTEPGALCIEVVDHGSWQGADQPGRGIELMQSMVGAVLIHVDERGSRVLLRHPLPLTDEVPGRHRADF